MPASPTLPPDSITTLPPEQRLDAIRARYNDMAYSGPTTQDRERDTVIGYLLDLIEERAENTVKLAQGLVDVFAKHLDESE